MRDVQYSSNTVLKAEPHGDKGVDAPHDETANDYIQDDRKHDDAFPCFSNQDIAGCLKSAGYFLDSLLIVVAFVLYLLLFWC